MLKGEYGAAMQRAMEILVAIGDANDAERMIPVTSAHLAGNYGVMRDEGIEWLEHFADLGSKVKIFTTAGPQSFDLELWQEMGVPKEFREKDVRIDKALRKLGVVPSYTCLMYIAGNLPRKGEHMAWASSETEIFANSILGAMTNRECDHSALAAAITGRAPEWGLHLPENRFGRIVVDVSGIDFKNFTQTDYSALAYYVGKIVGDEIPIFINLPKNIPFPQLFSIGYPLSVSGAVPMFHAVGITPEAPTLEAALGGDKPKGRTSVTASDVRAVYEEFSSASGKNIDLVMFGCPHLTLQDIKEIVRLLDGRRVHDGVKFWIFTSKTTKILAERMGYVRAIRNAGGLIAADTCGSGGPYMYLRDQGVHVVLTNSVKAAYYVRGLFKMDTIFAHARDCVEAAVRGVWDR